MIFQKNSLVFGLFFLAFVIFALPALSYNGMLMANKIVNSTSDYKHVVLADEYGKSLENNNSRSHFASDKFMPKSFAIATASGVNHKQEGVINNDFDLVATNVLEKSLLSILDKNT